MKNISTLILSLVMLFAGTQAFRAAETNRYVATIKSGEALSGSANVVTQILMQLGQLQMSFDKEKGAYIMSNSDGKVLFSVSAETQIITLAQGVTEADNIIYYITDEDRQMFLNSDDELAFFATFTTIELHFDTGGGGEIDTGHYVATIKTGEALSGSANFVTQILMQFGQLQMSFDKEKGAYIMSNSDGKVLFSVSAETQIITLAQGVTEADNVIHYITDEDKMFLNSDDELAFFATFTTIELHFDPSGGSGFIGGGESSQVVPERRGMLGTKGYWTFADGVLTVNYCGAMPTITKGETDPEKAFRYKWIDFLGEIQEVVVTGKDVEVQPYFLYYEGQETSDGQHPDDHIKTVRLGEEVKSLGRGSFSLYELKNLYCYRQTPPTLPAATYSTYRAFWAKRITANLTFLHIPQGTKANYGISGSEWANFAGMTDDLGQQQRPLQNNLANFETGELNQMPFFTEGDYPWTVTDEDAEGGRFSMKSGNKGMANTSSSVTAMYLFEFDGVVCFTAKCMGEGEGSGWDKCIFSIDGEQQFSYGAHGSGWSSYSFPVQAGMHAFKWEYTKDSSVDPEGDGFFVDNLYFLQGGKDDGLITGVKAIDQSTLNIDHSPLTIDHWFDLSGRKLGNKPTKAGLYIYKGRKSVVK